MYANREDQMEGGKFDESEVLNFVNSVETLNVVAERPVAGRRPTDSNGVGEEESYTLPSEGRKGLALVLNIVEFDDDITNVHRRYGSEQDMEYLTDLFIQLDYQVYPANQSKREQKNKSKSLMLTLIRRFKVECKREKPKSIIIFIGSHGIYPNQIQTSDYQWMDLYEDIVYVFTRDPDFTELDGKPKIFLVQACQSYPNDAAKVTLNNNNHGQHSSLIKDVYICTATMPGEPAKRDFYKGSWFPYCFTYMMLKHALKMKSLQQIMEMVKTMLGQIRNNNEFKQVPSNISINFDKPLYFIGSDYNLSGVRNYVECPSWLPESSQFCIICTIDRQITCEKITENLVNYNIHEWSAFAEFVSSARCRLEEGVVDVVMNCTLKNLKLALEGLEKVNRERVIFITGEDKQNVLKLNPSKCKVDVAVDQMLFKDLSLAYQAKIIDRLEQKHGITNFGKEHLTGELLVDIISGREMFFDELKPKQRSYYVSRTMLTRNVISSEIFKGSYCNDVFLVHGINQSDLSLLVRNSMTGRSQEQLENVTVNFMTLDKANHFDNICKKTSKSVHVLNYENDIFRWVQSRGNIGTVQRHVTNKQDEQREEDFCSLISSESAAPVCISDSPGMGKTILLAQIGRRLRRMFPDRNVLFVELNMFIQRIRDTGITDEAQAIEKALQDIVCKTPLGRHILKSKLTAGKVSVELLLDDFDEVRSNDIDFAHGILNTLRSALTSIRMWVTSRPHKLNELELTLGGLGYNIKPFQEQDQVIFLMRFWTQHEKLNTHRLDDFTRHCLKSLKIKMNSSEQDIAGIPLQCLLIGEVYEGKALEYAKIGETTPGPGEFRISSITTLYQEVIKKKIRIYEETFGVGRIPNDECKTRGVVKWLKGMGGKLLGKNTSSKEMHERLSEEKLNDMHSHLGISLLFPEMYLKLNHTFVQLEMEEVLNVGIWEFGITTGPRFIHRTFAEFFVALFIVDKLRIRSKWSKSQRKLFVEGVLQREESIDVTHGHGFYYEFTYPVITYFLNSLLVTASGCNSFTPGKVSGLIDFT